MQSRPHRLVHALSSLALWTTLATGVGLSAPAQAQYKVIDPDGRITYTDRPPVSAGDRVSAISRSGVTTAPADNSSNISSNGLPYDLRQLVARYPVTLYTNANCAPCDSGRKLLVDRGVPYVEHLIVTEDDTQALERQSGGRTLPSLRVGTQPVRGFNPTDWTSYLDAAGYPRESRLPRGWQAAPATPLVARAPAPAPTPSPAVTPRAPAPVVADRPASGPAFRF
jgi:glutaredoxin